jgi:hypothetical protein
MGLSSTTTTSSTSSSSRSGSSSSKARGIALELDALPRSYHCHQVMGQQLKISQSLIVISISRGMP